ncbi:hypothetical protein LCGC14_1999020 [marine sediment metagenome]|uniref:Protein ninG n=1 Tax=marine sediment metagenome TaxID=412755 RepID=A0A0F9HH75_9ZZZZ
MKKKRKKTISKIKKKADKVFSEYIRKRDKNICFTCNKEGNQAGHYISRRYNNTRYNDVNVHCQCVSCNIFKHGASDVYALRLQQKYSYEVLHYLNIEKNILKQWTIPELEGIVKCYQEKIRNL